MSRFLDALRVNNIIHSSWVEFFSRLDVINELEYIENQLVGNYTPCDSKVLKFATVDLNNVKVIILGQDPYKQKGLATGRSFEVANIKDWNDESLNTSLQNILKLIHKSVCELEEVMNIEQVRQEIIEEKFIIKNPNEAFEDWENQGVLFLNCAMTCEIEQSGSHINNWKVFFDKLLDYIYENNTNIEYFLWGKSRKYEQKLKDNGCKTYSSDHPRASNSEEKNKFFNNICFKKTKKIINWASKY